MLPLLLSLIACAGSTVDTRVVEPDYASPADWICRPDSPGVCGPQPVTTWHPDGSLERGTFTPDADVPIDCFYVYPTVDLRFGVANQSLSDRATSGKVVRGQAALLGSACRVWAPAYRQVTLGTFFVTNARSARAFALAARDVTAAFDAFLAAIGPDRRFVLVGHSQGAQLVSRIVRDRLDPDPSLRARLVAAYPIGWRTSTGAGARTGGSFANVPVCADAAETGCVVAYRSYAGGRVPTRPTEAYKEGDQLVCVNPAAPGSTAHARLTAAVIGPAGRQAPMPAGYDEQGGLFLVPDAYVGRCIPTPDGAALEVRWAPQDGDVRTDLLGLDHARWNTPLGTHVLDMALGLSDLVADVKRRAASRRD